MKFNNKIGIELENFIRFVRVTKISEINNKIFPFCNAYYGLLVAYRSSIYINQIISIYMGSKAKIAITIPEKKLWLGAVSRKYPSFEFRITAFVPISQEPFIGNSLISITGFLTEPVMKSIQNHSSLKELHVLKESACCIDMETRTFDPVLLQAIVRSSILVNLPVVIQAGIANFEISGSRENINEFMEFLESRKVKCELKEIGEFSQNSDYLLTPRQQVIFDTAKKSGFFEVPRKINLTALAEKLGMAKSTLSSMMQRIYAKLLGN